jgi:hypothetical protein
MIVAIHQPHYLPWLGYFYKILKSDVFVFLNNVQFEKGRFCNRNKIKTAHGPMWVTVPVLLKGLNFPLVSDVKVNNAEDWRKRHWKGICQNYARAPYFDSYAEAFAKIYEQTWEMLEDVNEATVKVALQSLNIEGKKLYKATDLAVTGSSTELLINICKTLGADTYLSGLGGSVSYLDEARFREEGIKLHFYDFQHPSYHQTWGEFLPNMSIIDLLFNEGDKSLDILHAASEKGQRCFG